MHSYPELPLVNPSPEGFAHFLRQEIEKAHLIRLNFDYIQSNLEKWWLNQPISTSLHTLKLKACEFFLDHLKKDDLFYCDKIGLENYNIVALAIDHIFSQDSPKLALVIHEALSDLFHLNDIRYDYEKHKRLYLKEGALDYINWGSGYGEISPHSDDIYEHLNIDYLSLTVCRDFTQTPTQCFFIRDVLKNFTEAELFRLQFIEALFKSGKNVTLPLERTRKILDYTPLYGFRFFLDFRVDRHSGERMRAVNPNDQILLDKMRSNLANCKPFDLSSTTGSFLFLSNYKVLHARGQMNLSLKEASAFANDSNLENTPRLLYRSKGQRKIYETEGLT